MTGLTTVISYPSANGGRVITILNFPNCIIVECFLSISINPSGLMATSSTMSFAIVFIISLSSLSCDTSTYSQFPGTPFFAFGMQFSLRCMLMVWSSKYFSIINGFNEVSSLTRITSIPFASAVSAWTLSTVTSVAFNSYARFLIIESIPPFFALAISSSVGLSPMNLTKNFFSFESTSNLLTSSNPRYPISFPVFACASSSESDAS